MGGSKSVVGTGVVGLVLALCLALAAPAVAGPRDGERGQRDVIADAKPICDNITDESDERLKAACTLRARTFSVPLEKNQYDETGVVDYSANRKPAQQETAMARQASSAVLSIDDVVTRDKAEQNELAVFYLCTYDQKARELGNGFNDGGANLAQDAVALARQISEDLAVAYNCLIVP